MPIYKEENSVLFNGLPPIPKGTALLPDGVVNYYVTVEDLLKNFYNKVQSDARYLKVVGGNLTGNVNFKASTDNILGFYWFNSNNKLVASIEGNNVGINLNYYDLVNSNDNFSLFIRNNSIGVSKDLGAPKGNYDIILAKYGILKNRKDLNNMIDEINFNDGYYKFKGKGSLQFFNESDTFIGGIYTTLNKLIINLIPSEGYILATTPNNVGDFVLVNKKYVVDNFLSLIFNQNKEVILSSYTLSFTNGELWLTTTDEQNQIKKIVFSFKNGSLPRVDFSESILKLGIVENGVWLNRPLGPPISSVSNNREFIQQAHLAAIPYKYDAVVKPGTVNNSLNEFNTVREAVLAGKKRILIKSGVYSITSGFWPLTTDMTYSDILIEGESNKTVILEGQTIVSSGVSREIKRWTFKNLQFRLSTPLQNKTLFSFYDGDDTYLGYCEIIFENCIFNGVINTNPLNSNTIGFDLYYPSAAPSVFFKNCIFERLEFGVRSSYRFEVKESWHHDYYEGVVFDNCEFRNLNYAIVPYYFLRFKIFNCRFKTIYNHCIYCISNKNWSGTERQGSNICGIEVSECYFSEVYDSIFNVSHGCLQSNWSYIGSYSIPFKDMKGRILSTVESTFLNKINTIFFALKTSPDKNTIYLINNLNNLTGNAIYQDVGVDVKNMFALSNTDCLFISKEPISSSVPQIYPLYSIKKNNQQVWELIQFQIRNASGQGNGDTTDYLSGCTISDVNFLSIGWTQNSVANGPSYARWIVNGNNSGWMYYFLREKNSSIILNPVVKSIDVVKYGNGENEYYHLLGSVTRSHNEGGVFFKDQNEEQIPYSVSEPMYLCELKISDEDIIPKDIFYIKVIQEDSNNVWVYINYKTSGFSKIYRALLTDVVNENNWNSKKWNLVYDFKNSSIIVYKILKAENSKNSDKIYIFTNKGVLYGKGNGLFMNWIGPKNVGSCDFNLQYALEDINGVVFNSNENITDRSILLAYYVSSTNLLKVYKLSLSENENEIYDNFENIKIQILNNYLGANFLKTICLNSSEEFRSKKHTYLIMGNKGLYDVNITETDTNNNSLILSKVKYLLGHTKINLTNGVINPVSSIDFEKSNILEEL